MRRKAKIWNPLCPRLAIFLECAIGMGCACACAIGMGCGMGCGSMVPPPPPNLSNRSFNFGFTGPVEGLLKFGPNVQRKMPLFNDRKKGMAHFLREMLTFQLQKNEQEFQKSFRKAELTVAQSLDPFQIAFLVSPSHPFPVAAEHFKTLLTSAKDFESALGQQNY